MWVSRKNSWNPDITPLEKFLAERLIQRCDYEESISNKHRTINGYTQLKELIKLCELSAKRVRTINTLKVILAESKSINIKQSICRDYIINSYFVDLKTYISDFDINSLNDKNDLAKVNQLLHNLKVFEKQLDKHYLLSLVKELTSIDYKEKSRINRELNKLSSLIDLLIPYFLFKGYSIVSVNEVLRKWLEKQYRVTAQRLINFFNFNNSEYEFIINIKDDGEAAKDFIKLFKNNLKGTKEVTKTSVNKSIEPKNQIKKSNKVLSYTYHCFDPHAHVRDNYDNLLKELVIGKDRKSLAPFTDYFDQCFWANNNHRKKRYYKIKIFSDPISVPARRSTLRESLIKDPNLPTFIKTTEIPVPENHQIYKSIYYYNLALGSKSIENSLSLLWTAIETIVPYRVENSDINNIKHLLSKSLSVGCFCRDIYSFISRLILVNKQNENCFTNIGIPNTNNLDNMDDFLQWYNWLLNSSAENFDCIKETSELLAYEYTNLAKPLSEGKIDFLLNRLSTSKDSIEYQLQRIYLHRNQIVHAGDMINEYSNLWLHLEWYIGKILYHCLSQIEFQKTQINLKDVFRQMEADFDYLNSYMNKNKNTKIKDSPKIKNLIVEHLWQAS